MPGERLLTMRIALLASVAVLVAMFASSAWAWTAIDGDRLPVHWDINGDPDRYGGKFEGLLVMPLIGAGLIALFAVIPRIEPRRAHLLGSMPAYVLVWVTLLAYLLAVHAALLVAAFGHQINMATVFGSGIGLLFIAIGAVLGRVRSNFMFGVRTPWTLSSERSWEATHRLAGRLFLWAGVATLAAGLVAVLTGVDWLPIAVLLAGALGAAVVSIAYSYVAWRGDPDRAA